MRFVMPGFMPGIHVLCLRNGVDGRDKPGHDDPYAIALPASGGGSRSRAAQPCGSIDVCGAAEQAGEPRLLLRPSHHRQRGRCA
jgi:hypothetical protein